MAGALLWPNLVEQGKLDLDKPIAAYWPAFGANGKRQITVREALTHSSGLPPDLKTNTDWFGYRAALRRIVATGPLSPPDTDYVYSDINFEVLGVLVRRITGEPLDVYCKRHIFEPLGMVDTTFLPTTSERNRIAPTEADETLGTVEVNDPTAYRMGGVAGDAGLFSTAADLATFAEVMLNHGRYSDGQILDAAMLIP